MRGSGGPGGTASYQWQCFLLHYGAHSSRLREAVTELARHLANGIIDWRCIRALMANRLIALNKCPGVHPIGVGECLCRVLSHVLGFGWEAQAARGAEQLACGCSQELKVQFMLCLHCIMDVMVILLMDGDF